MVVFVVNREGTKSIMLVVQKTEIGPFARGLAGFDREGVFAGLQIAGQREGEDTLFARDHGRDDRAELTGAGGKHEVRHAVEDLQPDRRLGHGFVGPDQKTQGEWARHLDEKRGRLVLVANIQGRDF